MSKMKQVTAGNNLVYERKEINLIYLLSELIDNSKASYENLISQNKCYPMNIDIEFNAQKGFIKVSDKAEGFDILKAISKVAGDENKKGETNQYGAGMKIAFNTFGDFSVLISQRKVDNKYIREMNFFIFKNGFREICFPLDNLDQAGSEILLFADYKSFYDFLIDMGVNKIDIPSYDNLEYESEFMSTSNTKKILDTQIENVPIIISSIFDRYNYLVNKFDNIFFNFKCIDAMGEDLIENGTLTNANNKPSDFYKTFGKNNFNDLNAFNMKYFFDLNPTFENYFFNEETSEFFLDNFEKLVLSELNFQYKKIKSKHVNLITSRTPNNIVFVNGQSDYQIRNSEIEKFDLFSQIFSKFMDQFMKKSDEPLKFIFKIKNLAIIRDKIIFSNKDDGNLFDIDVEILLSSKKKFRLINKIENENKSINYNNFLSLTGLNVILNNRSIYHGPNVGNNINKFNSILLSNNPPKKLLYNQLTTGKLNCFVTTRTSQCTSVKIGGNVDRAESIIFGNVNLNNSSLFTPGIDKVQISNIDVLENYLEEFFAQTLLSVLVNLLANFENQDFNNANQSKSINILNFLISEYHNSKIEKKPATDGVQITDNQLKKMKPEEKTAIVELAKKISKSEFEKYKPIEEVEIVDLSMVFDNLKTRLENLEKTLMFKRTQVEMVIHGFAANFVFKNKVLKDYMNMLRINLKSSKIDKVAYRVEEDKELVMNISTNKSPFETSKFIYKLLSRMITDFEAFSQLHIMKLANAEDFIQDYLELKFLKFKETFEADNENI